MLWSIFIREKRNHDFWNFRNLYAAEEHSLWRSFVCVHVHSLFFRNIWHKKLSTVLPAGKPSLTPLCIGRKYFSSFLFMGTSGNPSYPLKSSTLCVKVFTITLCREELSIILIFILIYLHQLQSTYIVW